MEVSHLNVSLYMLAMRCYVMDGCFKSHVAAHSVRRMWVSAQAC
jgi:hypothetical protein